MTIVKLPLNEKKLKSHDSTDIRINKCENL